MPYTLAIPISLGSSQTGLALSAQLVDTTGAQVGSAIASGFVELGAGTYLWTSATFPDRFRGAVQFLSGSDVLAVAGINPEEVEAAATVWQYPARTLTASASDPDAVRWPYRVTTPEQTPLEGVTVWATTDAQGTLVISQATTDAQGEAVFWLAPGSYYFWSRKSGQTFTNPDREVVA